MRRHAFLFAALLVACGVLRAQWEIQDSGTSADLRGISVDGGVAWASGSNGTVLRTEDGGYLWQACAVPPGAEHLDFRGIQAFDADTAIVMSSGKGDLSRLYETTDGCQTWKLILRNSDKGRSWDALYFDRHQWGWLLGNPVKGRLILYYSDDRGRTWLELRNKGLEAQAKDQGGFAVGNSSIAGTSGAIEFGIGGNNGAFVYSITKTGICVEDCDTEDISQAEQHTEWAHQEVPIGNHSASSGVFSLAARPGQTSSIWGAAAIVAVGGDSLKPDDQKSTAAFTIDGGKTWQVAETPPHGFRSAVAYDAATKTWITVGPNGTDISTDDGRNWHALHPDPALHEPPDADRDWNALSLPFVVGPDGRIGKLNPKALNAAQRP